MEYLFGRTCCSRLDYVEPRVGGQLLNIRFNTSLKSCKYHYVLVHMNDLGFLSYVHLAASRTIVERPWRFLHGGNVGGRRICRAESIVVRSLRDYAYRDSCALELRSL